MVYSWYEAILLWITVGMILISPVSSEILLFSVKKTVF